MDTCIFPFFFFFFLIHGSLYLKAHCTLIFYFSWSLQTWVKIAVRYIKLQSGYQLQWKKSLFRKIENTFGINLETEINLAYIYFWDRATRHCSKCSRTETSMLMCSKVVLNKNVLKCVFWLGILFVVLKLTFCSNLVV